MAPRQNRTAEGSSKGGGVHRSPRSAEDGCQSLAAARRTPRHSDRYAANDHDEAQEARPTADAGYALIKRQVSLFWTYTLYLDRAGLCTPQPTTDEIGRADSLTELGWLARGAAPFERAGRLWALDEERNTVMSMADIKINQECRSCERSVADCDAKPKKAGEQGCPGAERRETLRHQTQLIRKQRETTLEKLHAVVQAGSGRNDLLNAARRVLETHLHQA